MSKHFYLYAPFSSSFLKEKKMNDRKPEIYCVFEFFFIKKKRNRKEMTIFFLNIFLQKFSAQIWTDLDETKLHQNY